MLIRKAVLEDIQPIIRLRSKLGEYEKEKLNNYIINTNWFSSQDMEEDTIYFIKEQICFVAVEDDKLVGVITGEILPKKQWYTKQFATLNNIYVLEDYQRKGIGKKLYTAFEKETRNKGIEIIELHTMQNNKNAIEFYKKLGFEPYNLQMINKK